MEEQYKSHTHKEDTMNKGDIVKHRLNKLKMIVVDIHSPTPCPILCRWYDEVENVWKTENFMTEELIIFKSGV